MHIKILIALGIFLGIAIGIGMYTFFYARGISYLSDDPAACANCHIMLDQYNGWQKSSHHAVALCNDCHTPEGIVAKYFTKGLNGFNHSLAFTTGRFHYPIEITDRNHKITEAACRKCHQDMVDAIESSRADRMTLSCTQCHESVGHMH